jgi:hypothetical protein
MRKPKDCTSAQARIYITNWPRAAPELEERRGFCELLHREGTMERRRVRLRAYWPGQVLPLAQQLPVRPVSE